MRFASLLFVLVAACGGMEAASSTPDPEPGPSPARSTAGSSSSSSSTFYDAGTRGFSCDQCTSDEVCDGDHCIASPPPWPPADFVQPDPTNISVEYVPGCGIPTSPPCFQGLRVHFTPPFDGTEWNVGAGVNEGLNLVLVTMNSVWPMGSGHDAGAGPGTPRTLDLPASTLTIGKTYSVQVESAFDEHLYETTVTATAAP